MVSDLGDSRILELIREGKDKEVMPFLYKKVLPQLKNYISKTHGNRDDAYDVFHDALMIFYEQVMTGKYDTKYNVCGFLYKIGVFRWINKLKKNKGLVLYEDLPDVLIEESSPSTGLMEGEENIISTMFSQLGEKCVELLNYTIYSDMFMQDIMVRMNFASVEAVRMQHMRCKQKLMKELEKNPALLRKLKGE